MPRWTEEARRLQRERIFHQRPWTRSTGPRSEYGRLVSSKNAVKKHRRRQSEPEAALGEPPGMGDFAVYIGGDSAMRSLCRGKKLEIFSVRGDTAQCWIPDVPGLVALPLRDLPRC